jgi:hypothetical protein
MGEMQSQETGAAANAYGRETAQSLARAIGAASTSSTSNEFELNGASVTIRCAHTKTTSVGVTLLMLDRVSKVLGAFEDEHGRYSVYALSSETFKNHMRPTRSRGSAAGKVGLVSRTVFEQFGSALASGIRV